MSARRSAPAELRDASARHDVEHRLDETLFVEAGAGAGKTTALVARVVRLICSGRCELQQLAAVTFTEAAAAELRVRVRERLADVALAGGRSSKAAAGGLPATEEEQRLAAHALDHIDEATISTIHGFCQRLLAENPIEAGLPPRFEVLDEVQQSLEWRNQWSQALDAFGADAGVRALFKMASLLSVTRIEDLARGVAEEWDRCGAVAPDGLAVLDRVDAIVAAATERVIEALDAAIGLSGKCLDAADRLALRLEELRAHRDILATTTRWEDQLAALVAREHFGGQIGNKASWTCDVNEVRDALRRADAARDTALQECCDEVLPALVQMGDVLARTLAEKRRASGRLTFHDLLVLARDLLADHPAVLASARRRLRYLLIDEFQDTDPLQLEIAELLAFGGRSPQEELTVLGQGLALETPGPQAGSDGHADAGESDAGRIFFVGDRQQSIYRFRGADLDAYVAARGRHAGGEVTTLSSNFRSVPGILEYVNECFGSIIGAGFSPLHAVRPDAGSGCPVRVVGGPFTDRKLRRFAQREIESEACADAIERAVRSEKWMVEDRSGLDNLPDGLRPARLNDVAILVPRRTGLDQIETALDARGIGYRVESASLIFRSQEVRNLLALCRAIDAPGDELALVAALRSPAFGCGDDDLRAYRELEGRWSIEAPFSFPPPPGPTDGPAPKTDGRDPAVVVEALGKLASYRARRHELGAVGVLELAVRDRRLLQLAATTPRVRESWRRVRFLLEQARAFVDAGGGGLSEFADWVDEQLTEGLRAVESVLPEPDEDVVHILTVHGAKGLEFPITVLAGFGTTDALSAPPGPRVLRDEGRVEVRFRKGVETSGYGRLHLAEQARDQEEASRVLYVAATRARDHLIFCAHHLPLAPERASLGQSLYERTVAASKDNPSLCEFVELGDAGGHEGALGQGRLFTLEVVDGAEGGAGGGHDDGEAGSPAGGDSEGAASAASPSRRSDGVGVGGTRGPPGGGGADLAGSAASLSRPGAPSPIEPTADGYLSWTTARAALLARIGRPSSFRATEVAGLAGLVPATTDPGADPAGTASADAVGGHARSAGRAGTRIGRAVHATLQCVGRDTARALGAAPSDDSLELARLATAQARAERIVELSGEVSQLARAALSSPTVRAGFASPTLRRELYVSTTVGSVVLDGFVDLCFEDAGGLVVVDYKTDGVADDAQLEVLARRYELQAAAYALALGDVVGKPVSRCVLVFLRPPGAVEHEVADLGTRVAEVRAVVGAAGARDGLPAQDAFPAPDRSGSVRDGRTTL